MDGERAEWLNATLERIAEALERIADRLDTDTGNAIQEAEGKVILEERIAEAEARRKHERRGM